MAIHTVIMAGGAGTRLLPLTAACPKPLASLCGAPIMDYTLRLLKRHGLTQADVTLWYRPQDVEKHFGSGAHGVRLRYVVEDRPVGTAGSVLLAAGDTQDTVLVLSCGVGVQTVAEVLPDKKVYAGCDTYRLPGFQGVTPLEVNCDQCGECYLNLTGGICPITACSKSLVNGQCGGAKNGHCEVDPNMECGWERIYRRLEAVGRLDVLKCPTQVRNFATDQEVSKQ